MIKAALNLFRKPLLQASRTLALPAIEHSVPTVSFLAGPSYYPSETRASVRKRTGGARCLTHRGLAITWPFLARMSGMPQSKEALQRILRITEQQLAQVEARLVESLSGSQLADAMERATDLQLKIAELRRLLTDEQ
jgi:hypothetical protein